jgi:hypothetical protein
MTLSEDNKIQSVMREYIDDERKFRKIESDSNASFLDWKEDSHTRTKMSTLTAT